MTPEPETVKAADNEQLRDSRRGFLLYLVLLPGVCLLVFFGAVWAGTDTQNIAYEIGGGFVYALMISAAVYAVFARGGGASAGLIIFSAVFASFSLAVVVSVESNRESADIVLEGFFDEAQRLIDAQHKGVDAGTFDPEPEYFSVAPTVSGSYAEVQRLTTMILNGSARLANDYMADLDAIGWLTLLEPDRLSADVGLADSRGMLEEGKRIVVKHRQLAETFLEDLPRLIEELDLSAQEKRELRLGFESGLAESESVQSRVWDLEEAAVVEIEAIIDMLDANAGAWSVETDQMLFDTQALADRYNKHLSEIDSLMQEQASIQQGALNDARRRAQ